MDWIKDFNERFGKDEELLKLQAKRMHGSIQINFCDGHPVNYNLTIHKRGAASYTSAVVQTVSTLTKGD